MASGPGRALIRAEDLYDDLDVDERASTAVLCLETRDAAAGRRSRPTWPSAPGVGAGRPHAALRADGEPRRRRPGRRARRRDRAAQAARARLRRPARGERLRDLPAAAGGAQTTRRRSGARTTRSSTAARSSSPSTRPTTSSRRSSSACPPPPRSDYGEPFGKVLEDGGLGLLQDRSAAVQPGRGAARERRERAVVPRRRASSSTSLERSFRG